MCQHVVAPWGMGTCLQTISLMTRHFRGNELTHNHGCGNELLHCRLRFHLVQLVLHLNNVVFHHCIATWCVLEGLGIRFFHVFCQKSATNVLCINLPFHLAQPSLQRCLHPIFSIGAIDSWIATLTTSPKACIETFGNFCIRFSGCSSYSVLPFSCKRESTRRLLIWSVWCHRNHAPVFPLSHVTCPQYTYIFIRETCGDKGQHPWSSQCQIGCIWTVYNGHGRLKTWDLFGYQKFMTWVKRHQHNRQNYIFKKMLWLLIDFK